MRPVSPRRPITGRLGTRQPWQQAFSDIDIINKKRQQNIQPAEVSVSCVSLLSDGKSVLPYFFRDSQARLLVNESLSVSLKLSAGGRIWLIRVSGTVLYCYRSGFEMHTLQARSVDLLFLFFIVSRSVLLLEFDTH